MKTTDNETEMKQIALDEIVVNLNEFLQNNPTTKDIKRLDFALSQIIRKREALSFVESKPFVKDYLTVEDLINAKSNSTLNKSEIDTIQNWLCFGNNARIWDNKTNRSIFQKLNKEYPFE